MKRLSIVVGCLLCFFLLACQPKLETASHDLLVAPTAKEPTSTASPTEAPTFHLYPTSTYNATIQAVLLTPSPTTLPGYPTPEPPESYGTLILAGEEYIDDYVLRYWKAAGDTSFYATITLAREKDLLEEIDGIVNWEIMDVTGDGKPEIILNSISGGSMCIEAKIVYDVKKHMKILMDDGCAGRFENIDNDVALEYISYSMAYSMKCCVACAPSTMVVYDLSDTQGYEVSNPRYFYRYNEEIADKQAYLESEDWQPGFADAYCNVVDLALDYLYSGKTEKGWDVISRYYSGEKAIALKEQIQELLSKDLSYAPPEKFQPQILFALQESSGDSRYSRQDVEFSPDGRILASSTHDGKVQLWDTVTWKLVDEIHESSGFVSQVAFDPDGKRLAFLQDNTLKIYNLASRKVGILFKSPFFSSGDCVNFSPDGKEISFCSGGSVYLLDSFTGKKIATFEHDMYAIKTDFSPDGEKLAVGLENYNGDNLYLWDLKDQHLIMYTNPYPEIAFLAFSPNGKLLAVFEPPISYGENRYIKIRDAGNGEWIKTLTTKCLSNFVFSPDSYAIACGGKKKDIQIFDATNGDLLYTLLGHDGNVLSVTYSPDGKMIASTDDLGSLLLWDVP